ncbi:hypothetical protein DL96DRAFT_1820091 [Flagelloscypha sp. PMI_526]|nr:hypothetical protein DL96DRAFT_1820091 [Flagelloscypha sp. PMI_526]
MSLDPFLPPELEHRVFTLCASNDRQSIPVLLLVCHRVKDWIEPHLFRTIIFKSKGQGSFSRIISSIVAKSPEFRAQHVRYCAIEKQEHWDDKKVYHTAQLFGLCPEIHDLALWSTFPTAELLFPILRSLQNLRRLSLNWNSVPLVVKFLNSQSADSLPITHLLWEMDQIKKLPPLLVKLPRLTHIQFSWWATDDHSSAPIWMESVEQLTSVPMVELILIHLPGAHWSKLGVENESGILVKYPELDHIKVIVAHHGELHGNFFLAVEWELGVYGGDDLWTRAQKTLDQRRACKG